MHLVFCFQGAQEVPDKADHQVQGALGVARLAKAADLQEVDRSESVEAVVVKTNNVQSLIEELSVKMFLINF